MIALLVMAQIAAQAVARPSSVEHAVVIADVTRVKRANDAACQSTSESICIMGFPSAARITVRRVLFGKIANGPLAVWSGAPVRLKRGRSALLLQNDGHDWMIEAASRSDRPCFEESAIAPDDDVYAIMTPVRGNYCIVGR